MTPDQTTQLFRDLFKEGLLLTGPLVGVATIGSLLISVMQTVTSIQDQTISVVSRLLLVALSLLLAMPWYMHRLMAFAIFMLGDFKSRIG